MRRIFPAIWLSTRGIVVLLVFVAGLAGWSLIPAALFPVELGTIALIIALCVDLRLGPSTQELFVERESVPRLTLGRTAKLSYRIENRSSSPIRFGLLETPLPTLDFEREIATGAVAAHAHIRFEQAVLPRERGTLRFGTLYLWTENVAGLLRRRFAVDAPSEASVFPDLSAVERYGNLARRTTLLEAGLRRIRQRGIGSEFESLREYVPGDAFRSVDWKATARRGRLIVAQREPERSQQVIIVLDRGRILLPRIGKQRKFDYALTAALSVAEVARAADDKVGLIAFGARDFTIVAPGRTRAHRAALRKAVLNLQARPEEPDYERLFTELKTRYTKRSLIVLFTDIFDPVTSAGVLAGISRLVPRHLVICVLMNDQAIENALEREPLTVDDAYRTAVAMKMSDHRENAIMKLRSIGILVIDVPAPRLSIALLDAYLDVKARGAL
ncbi:MAG TPA: DUF58 domain-containing protein [Candidatus Baltobacteraceae bacterium]|nr:DUF58 domain-containing protein [Candidatus Baltobacteraceae bacterium]